MVLQIGIVITDKSVVNTTDFAAATSSAPYFAARSDVVLPAGVADKSTATPITKGLIPHILHTANTASGMTIRRSIAK